MELPLAKAYSQECEAPTFSTFLPGMDLTQRNCQGTSLLPGSRLQDLKTEEAQFSPRVPLGLAVMCPQVLEAASNPEGSVPMEELSQEGGLSLQAETRAWFQKTQAQCLLQNGAAPAWFHGFITRREAEKLLEPQPLGCYLVRFSESAITFVLTYRSQTCCRHFLLAQLRDGRHVVLGEDRAHTRLQDLLQHYTGCPLSPYGETLTQPLARQTPEPAGLSLGTEEADSRSQSQDPYPPYSPVLKKEQPAAPTPKERVDEPKETSQSSRRKPPIPAKPEVYTCPGPRLRPPPPPKPSHPIYNEPDEPIAFYAMGRGSPGEAPSNIYAEVEVPAAGSEGPQGALRHQVLRKCWSKPVLGCQKPSYQELHCENSEARQGQVPPRWGQTLPHLSRQVLQDRGQAGPSLGPPQ
ncbi:SH2 domain-containing protein 2A [Erinaceus europaeus]|uniref:SH2 domain-containing protein 2A n=1 Tax=Erinaceus europaeus TaxID=9365 RepID=A0ABM3Y969_ERIEU|nr:SH2 domain-containing protein 2A [Erinaceus europaeus]